MRTHRFLGDYDFTEKRITIRDSELASQLKNVLRLKANDKIILTNGRRGEATARIVKFAKNAVEVEIERVDRNQNEPHVRTVLYAAILKRENFELVVQKATEIGISEIVPLQTERIVKQRVNPERLARIVKEAVEQSGRGIVPTIAEPATLAEALLHSRKNDTNLFFDLNSDPVGRHPIRGDRVGVFVGPEGGWSEAERGAAREEEGVRLVSLGDLTLRAETAAVIAAYLGVSKIPS